MLLLRLIAESKFSDAATHWQGQTDICLPKSRAPAYKRLHATGVLPLQQLPSFVRDRAEGHKDVSVKEAPPVHLPIGPPEDLERIQLAAGQCHQLALHESVKVLEGHPGNAVLVDHHAGAERLH